MMPPKIGLQSPIVSMMIQGGGEAEIFLMLSVNEQGVVCLQLYVVTGAYPVYLEGTKLTMLRRSHLFSRNDVVVSRTRPCNKELFAAHEIRQRMNGSSFLAVDCEVRARLTPELVVRAVSFDQTGAATMANQQDNDTVSSDSSAEEVITVDTPPQEFSSSAKAAPGNDKKKEEPSSTTKAAGDDKKKEILAVTKPRILSRSLLRRMK